MGGQDPGVALTLDEALKPSEALLPGGVAWVPVPAGQTRETRCALFGEPPRVVVPTLLPHPRHHLKAVLDVGVQDAGMALTLD
jgi:hypothetical protein